MPFDHENDTDAKTNQANEGKPKFVQPNAKFPTDSQENPFKKIRNYFRGLDFKKKIIISVLAGILIIGIILSIALPLALTRTHIPNKNVSSGLIQIGDTQAYVSSILSKHFSNSTRLFAINRHKVESISMNLQSVTRMISATSEQNIFEFVVKIHSILQQLQNSKIHQKQIYEKWMEDFNKNPRQFTNKLLAAIKEHLSKKKEDWKKKSQQKKGDKKQQVIKTDNPQKKWLNKKNLHMVSIQQRLYIDVEYDPVNKQFKIAKFDQVPHPEVVKQDSTKKVQDQMNLKKQRNSNSTSQNKERQNKAQNSTSKKEWSWNKTQSKESKDQDRLSRIFQRTIFHMKNIVEKNIELIKNKSKQLTQYQNNFVEDDKFNSEWQEALVKNCRTIEHLRFRCGIAAVQKLVPGMTQDKIKSSNEDYVYAWAFKIIFKENLKDK